MLILRLITAAALGVSAYVHVAVAQGPLLADGQITLAGMFVGQAAVATLAALWLIGRDTRPAWTAAAVIGVVSFAALVLSVYVQIPAIGPFPALYEPDWYGDKVLAALSAAVAAFLAAIGLTRSRGRSGARSRGHYRSRSAPRSRRGRRSPSSHQTHAG